MAVRTISTRLAVEGEAQYKQAVASCNAELSTLKSSLALVESQFKGNANSMDALTAKGSALSSVYDKQKDKISSLESALSNAKDAQEKYSERIIAAKENIERCEKSLLTLKDSTGDTADEQAVLTKELEGWNKELQEAQGYQAAAERGVNNWQKQLNNANIELNGLDEELQKNNQYLGEAQKSADGCAISIDNFGEKTKAAKDSVSDLGTALVAAGVARLINDITDALASCVKAGMDFDATMSGLEAILGASSEEMDILQSKAREMGRATVYSATEAAGAFKYMAVAGADPSRMLDSLNGIINLAQGSGLELARTAEIVADSLEAFGLAAKDTDHFANVLAATTNVANVEVRQLGETLKYFAPVASALGFSVDDAAIAIALMANNGIKASQAGTSLRGAMTNLVKPTDSAAEVMERLGIEVKNQDGSMKSMSEVISILQNSFSGLTEAQQTMYAATIFGKESMSGMLAVIRATEQQMSDASEVIYAADDAFNGLGAAAGMAATAADNLKSKLQIMLGAATDFQISVSNALTPALEDLAEAGASAFRWASDFIDDNPAVVSAVLGVVSALGMLLSAFTAFTVIQKLIPMIEAFNLVLAANPAILVAAAVVGLTIAIGTLVASQRDANNETREFVKSLKESKKAYEENIEVIRRETQSTQSLITALLTALEAETKTGAQKLAILKIVEQLNSALPDLALNYDTVSDAINMETDSLKRLADTAVKDAEKEENVARLSQLYIEQTSAVNQLEEATDRLTLANEELAQTEQYLETGEQNQKWLDLAVAIETTEKQVKALSDAESDLSGQISILDDEVNAYIISQKQHDLAVATSRVYITEMESRVNSLVNEITELQAAYDGAYRSAYDSIDRQLGLFGELDGTAKKSISSLISTLDGQIEYMNTYADNIQKAMELGVDKDLVQKLSDGSQESAQILASIVAGGEQEIAALNEKLAQVEEGKENFSNIVADMETDFNKKMGELVKDLNYAIIDMDVADDAYIIGSDNIQGLIDGAISKKQELVGTYVEMAEAALAAYKTVMAQMSPSKKMFEAGSFDFEGLIQGAKSKEEELKATYGGMARAALDAATHARPANFEIIMAGSRKGERTIESVHDDGRLPRNIGSSGNFSITQNIYTPQYNYAEQQRAAARELKLIGMAV